MAEVGLDVVAEFPKPLTGEAVQAADVVITMGCGDACPVYPGSATRTGRSTTPPGEDLDGVRRIRDEIEARVRRLLLTLGCTASSTATAAIAASVHSSELVADQPTPTPRPRRPDRRAPW